MASSQLPQLELPQPQALWGKKQWRPLELSVLEMAGEKRGSTPYCQAAVANVTP